MQNMSHNLLLFCAPTWPSYHVIENQLFELFMRRVYLNYLFVSKRKPNNYKFAFRHTVHLQFIWILDHFVTLFLQDSNDNSPVFNLSLYSVQIYENVTTGSAILQLSAQDQDVKTSLQYSIVSGNSLERFFIDAYSGVLYVKNPIDRDPPKNENAFLLTVRFLDLKFIRSYRNIK